MEISSNINNLSPLSNLLSTSNNIKKHPPRHKKGEKFIKGPIPLNWMIVAMPLPGSSIKVALVIWFLAGLTNRRKVSLSNKQVNKFGISRDAKYSALKHLTDAGLILVKGRSGCSPQVTILEAQ